MKDIAWFRSICAANGLNLSDEQTSQFEMYRQLLLSANKHVNLISRKDEENFYPNHALNSISLLFGEKLKPDASVLDLGTGGGLPGIPILIIYRGIDLWLLDSIGKKTSAVSSILEGMQLERVHVVIGRAEELSRKREFQRRFDYVMSRAAGKLEEVAKWSRGFLKNFEAAGGEIIPPGTLIVLKGGEFKDELNHTRNLKFVGSVSMIDLSFKGMDEIYNKEKKIVLIRYKETPAGKMN